MHANNEKTYFKGCVLLDFSTEINIFYLKNNFFLSKNPSKHTFTQKSLTFPLKLNPIKVELLAYSDKFP